jgi:hypothetical protein
MTEESQNNNKSRFPNRKLLWNGRTITIISIAVILVTSVIVFFSSKRTIYDELEITITIIAFTLPGYTISISQIFCL